MNTPISTQKIAITVMMLGMIGIGLAGIVRAQTVGTTATSTAPTISSLSAQSSSNGTSATITWMTNASSTSQVAYGTTTSYSAYSGIDASLVTHHSIGISGLSPGTLYHFKAISTGSDGTSTSSSDRTFTTSGTSGTGTTTGTTTPGVLVPAVISGITVTPGSMTTTITWNTDQSATSLVNFGVSNLYGQSSGLNQNLTPTHSVTLSGLTPSTTYHFQIVATNSGGVMSTTSDQTFTTLSSGSSTDTGGNLQSQIDQLKSRIDTLEHRVSTLENRSGGGGGSGGGGTTGPISLTPSSGTFPAGGVVDFNGRNFHPEEQVAVSVNGQQLGFSHADNGGNFTTGSLRVPTTPGTYTYTFTGTSGDSMTSTVTVQ